MTDPIKIMDEIERELTYAGFDYSKAMFASLRTAIERQAEELAQARARIARLELVLFRMTDVFRPQDEPGPTAHAQTAVINDALSAIAESPRQSLAAVKAEVLLGLLEALEPKTESQCEMIADIGRYIDRIEREAKES